MVGPTKRDVYSWDSCVFLAHFKQEADKPLDDIRAVIDEVEQGKADMVVSTIVIAEILDVFSDDVLRERFRGFLRRPNIILQDVTPRIARLTAKMRHEWREGAEPGQSRNIKTPDAIIMTTAVVRDASVLHSHEPGIHRHSKTDLVSGMTICEPRLLSGQMVIPEGAQPAADSTASDDIGSAAPLPDSQVADDEISQLLDLTVAERIRHIDPIDPGPTHV